MFLYWDSTLLFCAMIYIDDCYISTNVRNLSVWLMILDFHSENGVLVISLDKRLVEYSLHIREIESECL